MKITFLGHSAVLIEKGGFRGIIDPFISGNPSCKTKLEDLGKITHIFVTHGHGDHIGDTIEIARKNESIVIANHEISAYLSKFGIKTHSMHIGGRTKFDFGTVKMTNAVHGSGISDGDNMIYGGNPCGFVIEIGGKKLYHSGDTGLTMDMKLLEDENIDVAFIPIGGNYTMDINDAVKAVEFIRPKIVIPMHYDTYDIIKANPFEFKKKVKCLDVIMLEFNKSIEI
jgi:L-ascorbate metabolism protein UlaG (beta-lactamase superfamily)